MDDSGDDDDGSQPLGDELADGFRGDLALDGASDDDAADVNLEAEVGLGGDAPNSVANAFQLLPDSALGDSAFSMDYSFERVNADNTLERYRGVSASDIVLDLSLPFFYVLRDCSNNNNQINISMKDIFCYHVFLCLRVHMNLKEVMQITLWRDIVECLRLTLF